MDTPGTTNLHFSDAVVNEKDIFLFVCLWYRQLQAGTGTGTRETSKEAIKGGCIGKRNSSNRFEVEDGEPLCEDVLPLNHRLLFITY